ncbi:MAG: hypothetical protein Kow0070_28670 [Anaerolineales bacterium]
MQNWLTGQQIKKMQEAQHRAMDAKIERMEEAEGAALAAAMKPPVKPQRDEQAWQSYRAGERASYDGPPPTSTATPAPLKTPQPAPVQTPSPWRTPMPYEISRTPSQPSSFPPRGYPDPNRIPQIPLALSRGGSMDIPHATSVMGLNLVQWGSSFSASTSIPARSLAELHEEMSGAPPSVEHSVKLGPLSLSAHRNIYGMTDYEISVSLGTKQITTPGGVAVEFSHSLAFRGESLGNGWLNRVVTFEYNYLDYTAQAPVSELPANSAQAGVYVKVVPWRLVAVAILVYGAWQILNTSPLGNPIPVLP